MNAGPQVAKQETFAALYIDFENIYYYLKNHLPDEQDPAEVSLRTIRKLRIALEQDHQLDPIVQVAYADFDRIEENVQSSLYLAGIETRNVLGAEHKNAADMRLCIDALETLYTRPTIATYVLVAGDRDYIPVLQHLRRNGKEVRTVAFRGNVSGDLVQVIGEKNFLNAEPFLPSDVELRERTTASPTPLPAAAKPPTIKPTALPSFAPVQRVTSRDLAHALQILLNSFGDKPEVWLTPYLHKLREELSLLQDYERKQLITELELAGVVRVERRPGQPNPYSVLLINWDHPDVRVLNP